MFIEDCLHPRRNSKGPKTLSCFVNPHLAFSRRVTKKIICLAFPSRVRGFLSQLWLVPAWDAAGICGGNQTKNQFSHRPAPRQPGTAVTPQTSSPGLGLGKPPCQEPVPAGGAESRWWPQEHRGTVLGNVVSSFQLGKKKKKDTAERRGQILAWLIIAALSTYR